MELPQEQSIERPPTFVEGLQYLLKNGGSESGPTPVRFLRYDPCPAIVIVADPVGQVLRCPREDLFLLNGISDGSAQTQPA
jgi:hypothetical protein